MKTSSVFVFLLSWFVISVDIKLDNVLFCSLEASMVTYLAIRLLYKWWMLMVFTTLINEVTTNGIALLFYMQVRRSMCRIKQVLTERALAEEDASRRKALRNMINGMWERREKWWKPRAAGENFKRTWAERLGEIKSRMSRWLLAPWTKLVGVR